ncbi:acyl-CoA N-acyltransferase [Papiliotrema laurentii]|uniref:Acyl-CoA N-acyltransferase n=1 Tax=Papiliotrema laurentii TaxID=5418 RepID=A0AAD9CVT8_PAPLA|nr:acyl-CoA N-acyltransferase [Papiliotrema laurentii]
MPASEIICRRLVDPTPEDFARCLEVINQGFKHTAIYLQDCGGDTELINMRDDAVLRADLLDREVWTASVDGEIGSLCVVVPPGGSATQGKKALLAEFQSVRPKEHKEWEEKVLGPLKKARGEKVLELNKGPAYHLSKLVTHPDHRRQGLASALMDMLVERLDAEDMAMSLTTQSEPNVDFYARWGFEKVFEAPFDYIDGSPGMFIGMLRARRSP